MESMSVHIASPNEITADEHNEILDRAERAGIDPDDGLVVASGAIAE